MTNHIILGLLIVLILAHVYLFLTIHREWFSLGITLKPPQQVWIGRWSSGIEHSKHTWVWGVFENPVEAQERINAVVGRHLDWKKQEDNGQLRSYDCISPLPGIYTLHIDLWNVGEDVAFMVKMDIDEAMDKEERRLADPFYGLLGDD